MERRRSATHDGRRLNVANRRLKAAASPGASRPFGALEWMVAMRYLRSRRWRFAPSAIAGFSLAGVTVGVFVLVVGMAVMNGFHIELLNKILGVNGHIFLQGIDAPLTDYDAVTQRVSKVPGVTLALPMIESAAGVSSPYQQAGALVRGVREADIKRVPGVADGVRQGTLEGFDTMGGVAIGAKLAQSLAVQIGDNVSLLTARGDATPFGVAPRIKSYPVQAIFQTGVSELDNVFVYMPLSDAQAFFNRDGEATLIEIFVENPDAMDVMRSRIEAAAGQPVLMTDWRERNRAFFDALKVESSAMFLILSLIIAVAALNIHFGSHHAGEGQGPWRRHFTHHGRDARRGDARLSSQRLAHGRHRHDLRRRARPDRRAASRIDSAGRQSRLWPQHFSIRISIFSTASPPSCSAAT